MRFEWDPAKADINIKRHGISFEEAVESFFDPDAADNYDEAHSEYEFRYNLIGFRVIISCLSYMLNLERI